MRLELTFYKETLYVSNTKIFSEGITVFIFKKSLQNFVSEIPQHFNRMTRTREM